MIINISLTNFYSLRDEAVIDFTASNSRVLGSLESCSNTIDVAGMKLLKSIALFGPNASGKSNVLKAVSFCTQLITGMISLQDMQQSCTPFKLGSKPTADAATESVDATLEMAPSKFETEFLIGKNRYLYGFAIRGNDVINEYLYSYPKKYKAAVFKRELLPDGSYAYSYSKQFRRPKEVETSTSSHGLFLVEAARMNREIPREVTNFFKNNVQFGLSDFDFNKSEALLEKHKVLVLASLAKADSDIIDFEFRQVAGNSGRKRLFTYHRADPTQSFDFEKEESAGTIRLLAVLLAFVEAAQGDKLLAIDELETSLHSQLVEYLVKMFNDTSSAQLLFSTHDLNLLNTDLMRPDQIYFTSKDYATGATELYSLVDFTDYKSYQHLRRDYNQGRFDAVPILN